MESYELEKIRHKTDIRKGISILPMFPLTSVCYLLVLHYLNKYQDNFGTYLVFGYGVLASTNYLLKFIKFKRQINKLINES